MSFLNFVKTKLFENKKKKIEWEKMLKFEQKKKLNAMNSTLHTEDIHVSRVVFFQTASKRDGRKGKSFNGHRIEGASKRAG